MGIIFLSIIAIVFIAVVVFFNQPQFGKKPSGKRLELIKKSPHYKNGRFENLEFTPTLQKGYSYSKLLYEQLFTKVPNARPTKKLPLIKTDLKTLDKNEDVFIWFGHSSYFIQLNGIKFLIDPVFSGNASPIPGSVKAFEGTDMYSADDFPEIDYLLITHDHYDHLDYKTVLQLKPKIKTVVCGLGVGEHFEYWGFDPKSIIEKDWNETIELRNEITLHTAVSRHFSGRTFRRNNTLWLSFVLETPDFRMFLGGDSGYGKHLKEIGKKYGSFDWTILDNGQYNLAWQNIHELPNETLLSSEDLNTKNVLPVHSSKFVLGRHSWDEPLKKVTSLYKEKNYPFRLATPKIGEKVELKNPRQTFTEWWKE